MYSLLSSFQKLLKREKKSQLASEVTKALLVYKIFKKFMNLDPSQMKSSFKKETETLLRIHSLKAVVTLLNTVKTFSKSV